jgi:WD40 repeat protein
VLTDDNLYCAYDGTLSFIDNRLLLNHRVKMGGFIFALCFLKHDNLMVVSVKGGDIEAISASGLGGKSIVAHDGLTNFDLIIAGKRGIFFCYDSEGYFIKMDVHTGQIFWSFSTISIIECLFYDEDNNRILGGSQTGSIFVWDYESGQQTEITNIHSRHIYSIANVNATTIATGSEDGTVKILDKNTWRCLKTFDQNSVVYSIAVTADGMHLIAGLRDYMIRVIRIDDGTIVYTLDNLPASVKEVVVSPNGRFIAARVDYAVKLFELSIPL